MSSSALQTKHEEIDNNEKRGKYTVSIIGCAPSSILQACLFADAGFKVICADIDQTLVNLLAKGKSPFLEQATEAKLKKHLKAGRLEATNDIKIAVSQSDVIALAMPVTINEKKKPDYTNLEKTCKLVGSNLRRGSLVIVMSTAALGAIEGTFRELLENAGGLKVEADFGLAYSPIQGFHDQALETMRNVERIAAATGKNSLNAASVFLETVFGEKIRKTDNLKIAEIAVLFEAVQRDVNVALANELAILSEKTGVDYLEVQKFVRAKASCLLPSATLEDENVREEPYLLLEDAESLNTKLRITAVARRINEEIVKHAINLHKDALRNCGKTFRRARISILGVSQKPNVRRNPKKMLKEFAKMLETRGAKISLYDPYLSAELPTELQRYHQKTLTDALEGTDCITIMTGHDQFKRMNLKKVKAMMRMPAAIVDFEDTFDPDQVRKEGFIYRGLGRGVTIK